MPPQIKFSSARSTGLDVEINAHVYKLTKSSFGFDFSGISNDNKDKNLDIQLTLNVTAPMIDGEISYSGVAGAVDRLFEVKAYVDRWREGIGDYAMEFSYTPAESNTEYKTTVTKFDITIPPNYQQIDIMRGLLNVDINAAILTPMISGIASVSASGLINHVTPFNFNQNTKTASLYTAEYEYLPNSSQLGYTIPSGIVMFSSQAVTDSDQTYTQANTNYLVDAGGYYFGNVPLVTKSAVYTHSGHYNAVIIGLGVGTTPSTKLSTVADTTNLPLTSGNYLLRYTPTDNEFDYAYMGYSPKAGYKTVHVVITARNNGNNATWEVKPFLYDVLSLNSNRVFGKSTYIDSYTKPRALYLGSITTEPTYLSNANSGFNTLNLYQYPYLGLAIRQVSGALSTLDIDVVYMIGSNDETASIILLGQLQQSLTNVSTIAEQQRRGIRLALSSDVFDRRDPTVFYTTPTASFMTVQADYTADVKLRGRGKYSFIAMAAPFDSRWTYSYPSLRAGSTIRMYRFFMDQLPL